MIGRAAAAWLACAALAGCTKAPLDLPEGSPPSPSPRGAIDAADSRGDRVPAPPPPLAPPARPGIPDEELGALMARLSESGGAFPSDNFVSNESSYLHESARLDALAKGGAYIGVGPEQNLTYAAMVEPEIAFVVDVRRDNVTLQLLWKWLFERAESPAELVALLTSRAGVPAGDDAKDVAALAAWVSRSRPVEERVRAAIEATAARARAVGWPLDAKDQRHLEKTVRAFAASGLGLAYTMRGSGRRYPPLSELLAARDAAGRARSFVADPEAFARVRALQRANLVVPVVGDFAGPKALRAIGDELRARKIPLRVLYVSNVEQYLFEGGTFPRWLDNVRALPAADDAVTVRVYFDQGRPHPRQRPGHRTTTMVRPLALDRRGEARSWWALATSP